MYYLLLFKGNNGYANAPQFYVVHALLVALKLSLLEIQRDWICSGVGLFHVNHLVRYVMDR